MPFADLERPSLALGLLKAVLARAGIMADVVYANLLFAEEVGMQASRLPLQLWFTPFAKLYATRDPASLARALEAELRRLRSAAPMFVDRLARDLLAGRPRIVACSSMFSQQVASLALLRYVRSLDPEVVTLLGGANVEGAMGAAVVRAFPWVDAVCSGEADEIIVPFCRSVADRGRAALDGRVPEGVITRQISENAFRQGLPVPRATASNLDTLPVPDFDEYFAALARVPVSQRALIRPALPLETSRGCWWGSANACAFCGLNRGGKTYRIKSSARSLHEMNALATRHGVRDIAMVDNVAPSTVFSSLLPRLAALEAPFNLYYEIRPPLSRENARLLAAAGVRHVQVGIEALHDALLTLMNKGTTVLQNVALLKHAREFGILVGWHLLTGFPGQSDDWYHETATWIPLIQHLQPPASMHGVTLQRFAAYFDNASGYGLEPVPYNSYEMVYPCDEATVRELAYFFRDRSWPAFYPEVNRDTPGTKRLISAVEDWRTARSQSPAPELTMRDLGSEVLGFVDTRSCAAAHEVTLSGLAGRVYRQAVDPMDRPTIAGRLMEQGVSASPQALNDAVEEIVARQLALEMSGVLLSLAINDGLPAAPPVPFPGGNVSREDFLGYLSIIGRKPDLHAMPRAVTG
jgi:ribosomal peptide maturation radical SAM protein 1